MSFFSLRLLLLIAMFSLSVAGLACGANGAVPDWFHRAWQTEDGLPDNTISGVAQSSDGYLWVSTKAGVNRFNGTHFHHLPLGEISSLPSKAVREMHFDRNGNVWIAMERGPLIRIGPDTHKIFGEGDGVPPNLVLNMCDAPDGSLWVAYFQGVCRIQGTEVTWFRQKIGRGRDSRLACDASGQVWLSNDGKLGRINEAGFNMVHDFANQHLNIAAARDGGLWISTESQLLKRGEGDTVKTVATFPEKSQVRVMMEDRHGGVWMGTQKAGILRVLNNAVQAVATSHVCVNCLTEDREGNIWAGTAGGGLNLIRPRAIASPSHAAAPPLGGVQSVTCDGSGRLWTVGVNGVLASRSANEWIPYALPAEVNCVVADAQDHLWVGARGPAVFRISGEKHEAIALNGHPKTFVRSLFAARNGDVWIATDQPDQLHRWREGKMTKVQHEGEFAGLRAMAEGADGTLWVGSSDGRLLRLVGEKFIDEPAVDTSSAPSIRCLHTTPDGSLWIGYAGAGLGHLKQGQFRQITRDDGLQDDFISQIQDDGEGSLWIAANTGLFKVGMADLHTASTHELRCRVFGRGDGVPSFQPSRDHAPTAAMSGQGQLYFSTQSGIIEVQPAKLRENTLPPPVVLEMVEVDQKSVAIYKRQSLLSVEKYASQVDLSAPQPHLTLPPDHDKVDIRFAALSMSSPENVQLRYRLSPRDKNWVELENGDNITLQRLPSGSYTFQVIACNNAGVWNETGATLGITVRPFAWETWWFRLGVALLTALSAGGLVFLALRRKHLQQIQTLAAKRAVEQERSRIARDIHDDLGASLTRITLLSQSQPSTNAVLDQIHATARHLMRSMEEVVWAVNPEHDTFDALANYLCNYGQGFLSVAGVRCRLEMPLTLPDIPLSAQLRHNVFLAFKEALNNAVKHAKASEVRISLEIGKDTFALKVQDNGEGIKVSSPTTDPRPAPGRGLANMKARMDEIGGTCILHSLPDQGTTIQFTVPFKLRE